MMTVFVWGASSFKAGGNFLYKNIFIRVHEALVRDTMSECKRSTERGAEERDEFHSAREYVRGCAF